MASKGEWYTKESTSKYMKDALYARWYMGTSPAEAMSNSKKIKHIALAIVELRESAR